MIQKVVLSCVVGLMLCGSSLANEPENLLPEGQFADGGLKGWQAANASQDWMLGRYKVHREDDASFVQVTSAPAIIEVVKAIDPAWEQLELTLQTRRAGMKQGANRWDVVFAELDFLDASGKSLLTWRKVNWLDGDTDGWEDFSRVYDVPEDAVRWACRLGYKAAGGTADFRDISVTVAQTRSRSEQAALQQRLAQIREAEKKAAAEAEQKRRTVQPADASRITGADIDESVIETVLHVAAGAAPDGDGSKAKPLPTLGAALKKADDLLKQKRPTRISLAPGIYREGDLIIRGGQLNERQPGDDTLLVIEGAGAPGTDEQVVLSASTVYPPAQWQAVRSDDGRLLYYQHEWTHDFGNIEGPWGQYNPHKVMGHRAEMLFLNGQPLRQVLLETYDYQPGEGWRGKGKHEYTGFKDPAQALTPGTFGVAERNDHPQGNRIFVKPPAGVHWHTATIEAPAWRHVLHSHYKSNLVLRNLVFQHAASTHSTEHAGLMIGHWHHLQQNLQNNNILLENVHVRWNNGFGAKVQHGKNVTVRNCRFHHNGHSGINFNVNANVLMEDCDMSFNNWRGHLGGLYGWAVGGTKLHQMRDCLLRNVRAVANLGPGIWFDVNNTNCLVQNADVIANRRGIFLEISPGPFLIQNALVAHDQSTALVLTNAANVTVENTILYNAQDIVVSACCNDNRGAHNNIEVALGMEKPVASQKDNLMLQGATALRNSVFVQPRADADLLRMTPSSPQLYRDWLQNLVHLEKVVFWSAAENPFGIGYKRQQMVGWERFGEFVGEGDAITWKQPPFTDPDQLDFTLPAGSPLGRADLPSRKLDADLTAKIRTFFDFWGYDGALGYKDDPLAAKKRSTD